MKNDFNFSVRPGFYEWLLYENNCAIATLGDCTEDLVSKDLMEKDEIENNDGCDDYGLWVIGEKKDLVAYAEYLLPSIFFQAEQEGLAHINETEEGIRKAIIEAITTGLNNCYGFYEEENEYENAVN